MIDFGPIWRSKWAPRGAQNGGQNCPKLITQIMMKHEGFQVPLGSVLGPSWAFLGSILGSKIMTFHLFYNGFVNILFLKKLRLRSASWTDIGPILTLKGTHKGPQIGSKMGSKNDKKKIGFRLLLRRGTPGKHCNAFSGRSRGGAKGEA